jgi:UDP-N-acetylglucosamine 1-carboxyvinyltransferase
MDRMAVSGGQILNGRVKASGAKNSALKLLFSTILAEGTHQFKNVPELKDIESTAALLESLGILCERKGEDFLVHSKKLNSLQASYDLVRKMRASILCLGPMLTKYGEAVVSLPGGCAIGSRPIDLHLDGMRALGAEIELKEGFVHAKAKKLKGATFLFENVTVGGTENMMMAAALAEGTTILENAAKEPEIIDLAEYLIKMGAKITGHGTSIMKIEGVEKLKPASHTVMPDRIEAGTLLIAGAITGGEVTVEKCVPSHLDALLFKLKEAGFKISQTDTTMTVERAKTWEAVDITTSPYPQFPTDLQAQFMSLMCVANGTSVISETVF